MRRLLYTILSLLLLSTVKVAGQGVSFEKTLRLDYIFSGNAHEARISLSEARSLPLWAGRRVNLDTLILQGNGSITLRDSESGKVLYRNSFSTLFQEWQNSEEATRVDKSFENTFLVPMPIAKATIEVELRDSRSRRSAFLSHEIDPSDILIRPVTAKSVENRYILRSGDPSEKIDIAIVAEGYTGSEMEVFYKDAAFAVECILSHEPFRSMKERLNFVAVGVESEQSGVSVPREGDWRSTALGSHFDTFYSARYLTTLNLFTLHDILSGIPYEHIIILANTSTYGGGGIYNSYVLSTAHHAKTAPVVVHEFGHSFGGLADEYFYDDQYEEFYHPDVEPWEPNITTLNDWGAKWKDLVGKDGVGYFEGGGYQSKGVWRPCEDCRMRTNENPRFCPVCERAIERVIRYNTEKLQEGI